MDPPHQTAVASAVARCLAIEAVPDLDLPVLTARIREGLERQIVAAIEQANLRVDRVELHTNEDTYYFLGYAGSTCRLMLHLAIDPTIQTASVTIRATKGELDAISDVGWGDRGQAVGNTLLVACVLHVGLVELRRGGVLTITNEPYDDRLRARYMIMGFDQGQRLELGAASALTHAFRFIAEAYGRYGISLDDVPI